MKDLTTFIIEAEKKTQVETPGETWVAIEIVTPDKNSEDPTKTKSSKRIVSYNTYMDMKKSGQASNGTKVISVNAISPSCPSKEKAQEYTKK